MLHLSHSWPDYLISFSSLYRVLLSEGIKFGGIWYLLYFLELKFVVTIAQWIHLVLVFVEILAYVDILDWP